MKTKKNLFTRMMSLLVAVLSLGLVLAFSAVPASAAEVPAEEFTMMEVTDTPAQLSAWNPSITAHAAGAEDEGGGTASANAESSYTTVLTFFITWLRRIGAAVALIGAIMFGLAIKDNDSNQKQTGLMTMVAGFVVVAICLASSMFDLFA